MTDKVDKALMDLTELAIQEVEFARKENYFDRELADSVCTAFSMYYGRFGNGNKQANNPTETRRQ